MPRFGPKGEQIAYMYYAHKRPDAPVLVLQHGFTASSVTWNANVSNLRKQFSVLLIDLLGHGESDSPQSPTPYGPEAAVGRIVGLFDQLAIGKAVFCGHSLGGALGLRLAIEHPERLWGVVIINSNSAAGTPEWRNQVRPGMLNLAERVNAEGTGFLKKTRLYPGQGKRLDRNSRNALMKAFDALKPAGLANTARALVVDVNCAERLPELTVPVLVVIGTRDSEFAANAPAFIAKFPPHLVQVATLDDAGHAANIERPKEFEAALLSFTESLGPIPPRPASGWAPAARVAAPPPPATPVAPVIAPLPADAAGQPSMPATHAPLVPPAVADVTAAPPARAAPAITPVAPAAPGTPREPVDSGALAGEPAGAFAGSADEEHRTDVGAPAGSREPGPAAGTAGTLAAASMKPQAGTETPASDSAPGGVDAITAPGPFSRTAADAAGREVSAETYDDAGLRAGALDSAAAFGPGPMTAPPPANPPIVPPAYLPPGAQYDDGGGGGAPPYEGGLGGGDEEERPRRSRALFILMGATLVAAGVGMFVAGALLLRGNGGNPPAEPALATSHATATATQAATRTAAASASPTKPTTASPTGTASATPTPRQTATPTRTPTRSPTATPTQARTSTPTSTATRTPTPRPTATPTPSGPYVSVSGPSQAAVGSTIALYANVAPGYQNIVWSPGGAVINQQNAAAPTFTFPSAGCYRIAAVVSYPSGPLTAYHPVSVGGAACS